MKRILFVDDDPHVLDGLRNMLHKHRRTWEMVFASSGDAALRALASARFDVVVSDMRMPGMDGATLLGRIREGYPSVTRIVLSGHAEQSAMLRALPVAHQFLSKPCDASAVQAVLERTCALQSLLQDDAIRTIVGRLDKLPSAPACHQDLNQAVASPARELASVESIIERDPAMSAKVLQLVNSGFFGANQRITSVQQAVAHLGSEVIRALVLSADVFGTLDTPSDRGFRLAALQEHSLATARLARRLVSDPRYGEEAFAAAIVHDIGKIVLALGLPDQWRHVLRAARASRRPVFILERELLGVTHAEIGAYLLGVWGVPAVIVGAVTHHHTPRIGGTQATEVLAAVHAADALVNEMVPEEEHVPGGAWLDAAFIEEAGLAAETGKWREIARAELSAMQRVET